MSPIRARLTAWWHRRRAARRAVEDSLARADQADRRAWIHRNNT